MPPCFLAFEAQSGPGKFFSSKETALGYFGCRKVARTCTAGQCVQLIFVQGSKSRKDFEVHKTW